MQNIKAGVIGGSGYTAGELLRLLVHHSKVSISFVYSRTNAGKPLSFIHKDLIGETDLCFTNQYQEDVDVLFLCVGHGIAGSMINELPINPKTKIIDLSNEFRLDENAHFSGRHFVYGLPELQKEKIKQAENIANPGCFATAIQLAILPLAKNQMLPPRDIHVHAITGSTGAGQYPSATTHFSWRNNNISAYKVFTHQHLGEINQTIKHLQPSYKNEVVFVPIRGNFSRGIFASVFIKTNQPKEEIIKLFKNAYKDDPFAIVSEYSVDLKQAVGTNKCVIHIEKQGDKLLIASVIDNLIKGASGQAIENMNLMFGSPRNEGLKLKSIAF